MRTTRLAVFALATLALAAVAAPAEQRNANDVVGPEVAVPEGGGAIDSATLDVLVVNDCYALVTGTVTASGGGRAPAALTVYDDGVLITGLEFEVPANGGTQPYCWVHQQIGPAGGDSIAIAIRDSLLDAGAHDFENFAIFGTCTGPAPTCAGPDLVAVPALGPGGIAVLALGLAGAGAFALRVRRRRQRV